MLTPLKRKSIDIGIFGNKSRGKTIVMNALLFFYYLMGYKIFTNQNSLTIPHVFIDSITGLQKIQQFSQDTPKVMGMEDFERWLHSRNAKEKTNMDIATVVIDNGKNNCCTIATSKRPMALDIAFRETMDFFLDVRMIMPIQIDLTKLNAPQEKKDKLQKTIQTIFADYLECDVVQIDVYTSDLIPLRTQYLPNLNIWGQLYKTQEIIKEVKTN